MYLRRDAHVLYQVSHHSIVDPYPTYLSLKRLSNRFIEPIFLSFFIFEKFNLDQMLSCYNDAGRDGWLVVFGFNATLTANGEMEGLKTSREKRKGWFSKSSCLTVVQPRNCSFKARLYTF